MIDAPPEPTTWQQVLAGERRWACACSDALAFLRGLPDCSVNCCVTSPPYYALRDYGTGKWVGGDPACKHKRSKTMRPGRNESRPMLGDSLASNSGQLVLAANSACRCGAVREDQQIGLEESPAEFVAKLVGVFREVRRVLAPDGVCFVNMGDTYANDAKGPRGSDKSTLTGTPDWQPVGPQKKYRGGTIKKKDQIGVPWMLAFALRDEAGFYLRQEIIWAKGASGQADIWANAYAAALAEKLSAEAARRIADAVDPFVGNPMPHSVRDRCATSHEHVFLLSKSRKYHWDDAAIADPCVTDSADWKTPDGWDTEAGAHGSIHRKGREKGKKGYRPKGRPNGGASFGKQNHDAAGSGAQSRTYERPVYETRKRRSVWLVTPSRYRDAHFATFPPALVKTCVLAGCPAGGVVLDPFTGSGTTAQVAVELGRRFIGSELNPAYLELIGRRMAKVRPTLFSAAEVA